MKSHLRKNIRIDEHSLLLLSEVCKRYDRTLSEVVRAIIWKFLEEVQDKEGYIGEISLEEPVKDGIRPCHTCKWILRYTSEKRKWYSHKRKGTGVLSLPFEEKREKHEG
jgi:hypothetical protein